MMIECCRLHWQPHNRFACLTLPNINNARQLKCSKNKKTIRNRFVWVIAATATKWSQLIFDSFSPTTIYTVDEVWLAAVIFAVWRPTKKKKTTKQNNNGSTIIPWPKHSVISFSTENDVTNCTLTSILYAYIVQRCFFCFLFVIKRTLSLHMRATIVLSIEPLLI